MDVHFFLLFCAIVLDLLVGDPDWIWRKIPHPVVYFGAAISFADRHLNQVSDGKDIQKGKGIAAIICLLLLSLLLGYILNAVLSKIGLGGFIIEVVIVSILIAQKSMSDHIKRIYQPLQQGDLEKAKQAVSMIVGRDTQQMNVGDVSRASIESLSENFSDGVVAPVFWYAIFGLPGIFAYKMLNTADSMIGHRTIKYNDFGWASAKIDDLANGIPARLSAFFIAVSAFLIINFTACMRSFKTMMTDARLHKSPNAGWPESAMAGALDIALAGPRVYAEYQVNDAYLNASGRLNATTDDLSLALKIFRIACVFEALIILGLCVLTL